MYIILLATIPYTFCLKSSASSSPNSNLRHLITRVILRWLWSFFFFQWLFLNKKPKYQSFAFFKLVWASSLFWKRAMNSWSTIGTSRAILLCSSVGKTHWTKSWFSSISLSVKFSISEIYLSLKSGLLLAKK